MKTLVKLAVATLICSNAAYAQNSEAGLPSQLLENIAAADEDYPVPSPSAQNAAPLQPDESSFPVIKDLSGKAEPAPFTGRGKAIKASPAPAARLDLRGMQDDYMLTDLAFNTRGGQRVHVSLTKALNCPEGNICGEEDTYFLLFRTDSGLIYNASAYEAATYLLKRGYKNLYLDGNDEKYTVRLYFNKSDMPKSIVKVINRGNEIFAATVADIISAMSRKARRIQMSRTYMVFLGSSATQDGSRQLHFDFNNPLLMLVPESGGAEYFLIAPKDITERGVVFPSVDKRYTFKKSKNGSVEIFR